MKWQLSQVEAFDLHRSGFESNMFVADTLDYLRRISTKKIIVTTFGRSAHVFADRERTAQVLINLVTNAFACASKGSKIMVRTESSDESFSVHVQYFDKGTAIDQHGLAISKENIELQDGEMWFSSEPGCGSIFSFSLPLMPMPVKKDGLVKSPVQIRNLGIL